MSHRAPKWRHDSWCFSNKLRYMLVFRNDLKYFQKRCQTSRAASEGHGCWGGGESWGTSQGDCSRRWNASIEGSQGGVKCDRAVSGSHAASISTNPQLYIIREELNDCVPGASWDGGHLHGGQRAWGISLDHQVLISIKFWSSLDHQRARRHDWSRIQNSERNDFMGTRKLDKTKQIFSQIWWWQGRLKMWFNCFCINRLSITIFSVSHQIQAFSFIFSDPFLAKL